MRTRGLLVFAGVVGTTFWLAARATGGVDRQRRRELPGLMAHSLIPIVIGYVFAHYLTYLVERGQQTVLSLVFWLLGDAQVHYVLSMHPSVLATLKVVLRGGRPHRGRDRRARPGAAIAAQAPPADRAAGDDAGDGRLHVHRAVPVVRRIT